MRRGTARHLAPGTTMRDQLRRKAAFILLQLAFVYAYAMAWLYSMAFARKRHPRRITRIAAVCYGPRGITGADLRQGYWKRFFEAKGIQYDSFWSLEKKEFLEEYEAGSWPARYHFYRKALLRRLRLLRQLRNYDVVWIVRGFLPFYPVKRAFFERCLRRMGVYVVVDCTDGGDYLINPELVLDTMAQADTITVHCKHVKEFYQERFPKVVQVQWTIPDESYVVKTDYSLGALPTLGWMGSPDNFENLERLRAELTKLARVRPFRLLYICRADKGFEIPGAVVEHRPFGDDYYQLLARFDVGLCPFPVSDMRSEGKVAMKHQEFLLCGIPQVCSPVAISEFVVDGEHALIAPTLEDWGTQIQKILDDDALRASLGRRSRELFLEHYTYEGEFPKLYQVLTDFSHVTRDQRSRVQMKVGAAET